MPIGWKCNGFENLGFKDGENFIVAENKETLSKYLSGLQDTKLSQIARNAQKLVFEKHSDYARISQLSESLKLIIDNSFNISDIALWSFVNWINSGTVDGFPNNILKNYPKIEKVFNYVNELPEIKEWIKNKYI